MLSYTYEAKKTVAQPRRLIKILFYHFFLLCQIMRIVMMQCESGEMCYSTAKTPNEIPQKHRTKYRKNAEYIL